MVSTSDRSGIFESVELGSGVVSLVVVASGRVFVSVGMDPGRVPLVAVASGIISESCGGGGSWVLAACCSVGVAGSGAEPNEGARVV